MSKFLKTSIWGLIIRIILIQPKDWVEEYFMIVEEATDFVKLVNHLTVNRIEFKVIKTDHIRFAYPVTQDSPKGYELSISINKFQLDRLELVDNKADLTSPNIYADKD